MARKSKTDAKPGQEERPGPAWLDIEALLRRRQRAEDEHKLWVQVWTDIYEYSMPNRRRFHDHAPAQRFDDKIFDETAVIGTQEFASRILAGVTPPWTNWMRFEPGSMVPPESRTEIGAALDKVSDRVFEELANSNFVQEAHECYQDLAVGTGYLYFGEGDAVNPFRFQAKGPDHVLIDTGPFGNVDAQFEEIELFPQEVPLVFPGAREPDIDRDEKGAERKVKLYACTWRDWNEKGSETYRFALICPKEKEVYLTKTFTGQGSNPWIVPRWSTLAGERFGRGPLFNALAAIKTCNLTVQLVLQNASIQMLGMWQGEDDGILNPKNVVFEPASIIVHGPGSQGLRPLEVGGSFDVSQLVLNDMRHNIRKALYNETLGPREGTPPSATEVAQRMSDLANQMGAPVQRIEREFAIPVIKRAIHILRKRGMIEMPEIDGRKVKATLVSPLARAQEYENFTTAVRYLQAAQSLAGPQIYSSMVKLPEALQWLAQQQKFPESLINDPGMMKAQAAQTGQMVGQAVAGGVPIRDVADAAAQAAQMTVPAR